MPQNPEHVTQYFVRWRGHVEGPYPMDRLKALLGTGRITRHHQISTDRETWSPLSSLVMEKVVDEDVRTSRRDPAPPKQSGLPQPDIQQQRPDAPPILRLRRAEPDQSQAEETGYASEWFYLDNDQVVGPVSKQDIQSMLHVGRLAANSQICRQGEERWQTINSLAGLFVVTSTRVTEDRIDALGSVSVDKCAGFWQRVVASLFDSLIMGALVGAVLVVLGVMMLVMGLSRADAFLVLRVFGPVLCIVGNWAYVTCMESSPRQATFGKIAMGIYVVDSLGQATSFGRANARYWSKAVSAIPLMAGFLMAAFTQRKQALHDFISGTFVLSRE